jgi:hypothetical protein
MIDPRALAALADTWISLGAPIRRLSDYIAVALLRVSAARTVMEIVGERRRLRIARLVLHATCVILVAVLLSIGAYARMAVTCH